VPSEEDTQKCRFACPVLVWKTRDVIPLNIWGRVGWLVDLTRMATGKGGIIDDCGGEECEVNWDEVEVRLE